MQKPIVYDPNEDIEERAQLYVARSTYTGLYTRDLLHWLRFNQRWIDAIDTDELDVIAEVHEFDKARCPWTHDLNRADVWDKYWIAKFQKYLTFVTWTKLKLATEPIK